MQAKMIKADAARIDLDPRQPAPLKAIDTTGKQRCQDCALHKLCVAKSVDEEGLDALNQITSHPRPLHKGEYFYRQSDPFEALYVVRSGAVKTFYLSEKGEEHITGFYRPGELFGIDGLFAVKHRYSAQALDTAAVCTLPYNTLEQQYTRHPDIQRRVTELICDEIFQRQQPLIALHQYPAEERLASFLMDISRRLQQRGLSATDFNLPMPRRDIARYLGLAEETISRLFTRFQDRALISVQGRNICNMDLERLQAMSLVLH